MQYQPYKSVFCGIVNPNPRPHKATLMSPPIQQNNLSQRLGQWEGNWVIMEGKGSFPMLSSTVQIPMAWGRLPNWNQTAKHYSEDNQWQIIMPQMTEQNHKRQQKHLNKSKGIGHSSIVPVIPSALLFWVILNSGFIRINPSLNSNIGVSPRGARIPSHAYRHTHKTVGCVSHASDSFFMT